MSTDELKGIVSASQQKAGQDMEVVLKVAIEGVVHTLPIDGAELERTQDGKYRINLITKSNI